MHPQSKHTKACLKRAPSLKNATGQSGDERWKASGRSQRVGLQLPAWPPAAVNEALIDND